MKLKELLKFYYGTSSDITMSNNSVVPRVYKELILPGSFNSLNDYRKTLSWNLDRDVYYREAAKEANDDSLYVTITTGKMDFFFIFNDDKEFLDLLNKNLKKHRSYRKETISMNDNRRHFFYSRKYE